MTAAVIEADVLAAKPYDAFIATKAIRAVSVGIDGVKISKRLFPFQQDIVRWALRRGRAAIFADCFLPGTLVKADGAYRPIEECREGMVIETLLGPSTIERSMSREHTGDIVSIKTSSGFFPVRVTPNHKFYVWRDDAMALVRADELSVSDHLLYRQPRAEERATCTAEAAYVTLAGYWLAEGWTSAVAGKTYGVLLGFHTNEETTLVADTVRCFRDLGLRANIQRGKTKHHVLTVAASSHKLATRLVRDFGSGSASKRLPGWVMDLGDDQKIALLRALFLGDAHIKETRHPAAGRLSEFIRWVTVSYELASGVRDLLLSLGIRCSALVEESSVGKSGTNHRRCYRIQIARRFMARLGFNGGTVIRRDLKPTEVESDGERYSLIAVRRIERGSYAGPVYNLTSAGHDSYLTDAGTSKNCGMGKTAMQLEWARHVAKTTKGKVLILAPLSVAKQTVSEGEKFGIPVTYVRDEKSITGPGIWITNYEMLSRFTPSDFAGVVLDESSILKSYDGKTRTLIIESFRDTPYRLACTATPAPNDFMELGNHTEFLGVMTRPEMLATFFVHDGGDTSEWRLKGHAEDAFWKWICSWGVMIRKPSDLGYEDGTFVLPPLNMHHHCVETDNAIANRAGLLFAQEARSLTDQREARKASLSARVERCAGIVNATAGSWLVWCDLNAEGDALTSAIDGAVQVSGADSPEKKEQAMLDFISGRTRVLISKVSIFGFGMNLQNCSNMAFVGLSNSYEQFYQAVRRCWRFGQTRPVACHLIASDAEGAVLANVQRKEKDATQMAEEMVAHMVDIQRENIKGTERDVLAYTAGIPMLVPSWIVSGGE